jgi:Transposase DDE domain
LPLRESPAYVRSGPARLAHFFVQLAPARAPAQPPIDGSFGAVGRGSARGRGRRSAIDGRTTRHDGYAQSQRARKRIEEAFGWIKTIAGQARARLRGLERVRWSFTLAAAAYNLIRLRKLIAATP